MPSSDEHRGTGGRRPPGDALAPFLARVADAAGTGSGLRAVPVGMVPLFGLDALTLSATARTDLPELVWSDPPEGLGPELEELQYALDDGPTLEAARHGFPLGERDLAATGPARWPVFLPAAAHTPVRAVFAFPLRLGVVTIGVLTGYRVTTGGLTHTQHHDLVRLSRVLGPLLLDPEGAVRADETGPRPDLVIHRAEIHQSTGYLSARLGVPPNEALLRLRAYATAYAMPLTDLARDLLSAHPVHDLFDR
ncbi:ANTAR domain-containing protein [Streptomyces sp. NPDC047070]|uniref:ANTAR domain-containing protein n=1 Tax=Streptomyces sp. NPDC047070 TaxID=3154923 RepID=UPI003453CD04